VYGAIAIPLVTGTSIVLGVLVGDPMEGAAAAAVGLAGVGAALAMGNIFAVALAYPMQKRAGNPMPQPSQGYNGYAIAAAFGTLAAVAVAVIPVIILANLTSGVSAAMRLPVLFGCAAPTASASPGSACAPPPSRPRSGCRSYARSPCAPACSAGGRAPPDAGNLFSCEIRIYRYGASTGPSCLT
jgi:hypothetical protein